MKEWAAPAYFKDLWLPGAEKNAIKGFKVDEARHFDPILRPVAQAFCDHYGITDKCITQFLSIEPNEVLPWHEDGVPASCCVNCLLSDGNAPVEFEDGIYQYDVGLLNIRKKHRVVNGPYLRTMFRIVFYEASSSYDVIRDKINAKDLPQ
jgi:hypothetical protein